MKVDEFMQKDLQSIVDEEYSGLHWFMRRLIHLNECKETIDLMKIWNSALMDYKDNKS
jgi:glutathionyl-hydroquinone reductase